MRLFKRQSVNQAFLTAHHLFSISNFSRIYFLGNQDVKIKARAELKGEEGVSWVSRQRRNHFESATLTGFEKSCLIFMSVLFISFDISFSKTADIVRNHVGYVNLTIYQSMYELNPFVFKQIKRVNDEKQLLRIIYSLYFEIKCNNNNNKKHSSDFFY